MLLNNPKTVVQVKELKKIPSFLEQKHKFGFDAQGKIDFFFVGNVLEPDDLNLEALVLTPNLKPKPFDSGITKELDSLHFKFSQLGILYSICRKYKIFPGADPHTDIHILSRLRETLSDNITNPDQVVKEFVQRWNEIAALPIAKDNLKTVFAPPKVNKGPFTFHLGFAETLNNFLEAYCTAMINSPSFKTALLKVYMSDGFKSFEEIPQTVLVEKKKLIKKSYEREILFPELSSVPVPSAQALREMKIKAQYVKKLFNQNEPYDQKAIDFLYPNRKRTYVPSQESKDQKIKDKRDLSPSRSKETSSDACERKHDRRMDL